MEQEAQVILLQQLQHREIMVLVEVLLDLLVEQVAVEEQEELVVQVRLVVQVLQLVLQLHLLNTLKVQVIVDLVEPEVLILVMLVKVVIILQVGLADQE